MIVFWSSSNILVKLANLLDGQFIIQVNKLAGEPID